MNEVINNNGLKSDPLPTRLKVLSWGTNRAVGKPDVIVNEVTLSRLIENNIKTGLDVIAIDFEHNTLEGLPEPLPVAGYGIPEVVDGDGVYLTGIDWTPHGIEYARDYVDLSPVVGLNGAGEAVRMLSVALTRAGAVEGLHFYTVAAQSADNNNTEGDTEMEELKELKTKVDELTAQLAKVTEDLAAMTVASDADDLAGKVEAMSVKFESELLKRDKETLLREAAAAGKNIVLPETAVAAMSVFELKDFITKAPANVPINRRTPALVSADSQDADVELYNKYSTTTDSAERTSMLRKHSAALLRASRKLGVAVVAMLTIAVSVHAWPISETVSITTVGTNQGNAVISTRGTVKAFVVTTPALRTNTVTITDGDSQPLFTGTDMTASATVYPVFRYHGLTGTAIGDVASGITNYVYGPRTVVGTILVNVAPEAGTGATTNTTKVKVILGE